MLCRACGMQNKNHQATFCEWCKKPMAPPDTSIVPGTSVPPVALTAPIAPMPDLEGSALYASGPPVPPQNRVPPLHVDSGSAPTARIQRRTLTGELIDVEVPSTPPQNAPPVVPGIGAPYAAMHTVGASYQTMAPQMLKDARVEPQTSPMERWECFLAIACPVLLLSGLLIHNNPGTLWWVTFLDLFVLSIALGGSGAVPKYDDAYFDVAVMLVVTYTFGPLAALVVYLLTAAVKQECNTAVVGLLGLQLVIFQGMPLAFMPTAVTLKHIGAVMLMGMLNGMAVSVAFFGWLLSSLFRPLVE